MARVARRPTLLEFRLASVPGLGELLTRPNPMGTRMLWRKAFAAPDRFVGQRPTDERFECRGFAVLSGNGNEGTPADEVLGRRVVLQHSG